MNIAFDMENVTMKEFGVGSDEGDGQCYYHVPVDVGVQDVLYQMVAATISDMRELTTNPKHYVPSEKYDSLEYVYISLDDDLARGMKQLHEASNLETNVEALSDPTTIFCYLTRLSDKHGQRLTAVRRATQFKGILKSHGRLIHFGTDALEIVEDKVFKLDNDFDFLIDNHNIHVIRPSSFEFAGKLTEAILLAVPQNIKEMQKSLNFVEFSNILNYATEHPRAARYLASIRTQGYADNINMASLVKLCQHTGVKIQVEYQKIQVEDGNIMGFLEVLDRRRFEIELVIGSPESWKATSREQLQI